MSVNKWTVEYKSAWFYPPGEDEMCYGLRWCVTSPIGVNWSNYATWREAIECADKQARTISVTLPRVHGRTKLTAHNGTPGGHPNGYTLIPRDKELYCAMTIVGPWGRAGIFDAQDLEPLALALLAHHYKQKVTEGNNELKSSPRVGLFFFGENAHAEQEQATRRPRRAGRGQVLANNLARHNQNPSRLER